MAYDPEVTIIFQDRSLKEKTEALSTAQTEIERLENAIQVRNEQTKLLNEELISVRATGENFESPADILCIFLYGSDGH